MGFEIKELIIGQGFVAKSYDNCSLVLLGFLKICFTIFFFSILCGRAGDFGPGFGPCCKSVNVC